MKIYFLVEGVSSEKKVYPAWTQYFLPSLIHFKKYDDFYHAEQGFYVVSGGGYPSILTTRSLWVTLVSASITPSFMKNI